MPVITCPGCGVRLKFDPQPTSKLQLTRDYVQKVMRLASPASSQSGQRTAESDPLSDSAPKQKAIQKSSASSAPLSVSSVKSSNAATSIDPSPTAMEFHLSMGDT